MQYLVNREFIAQDLYGGLAQPMITHVSPSDFDFLTVYDIDRGSGIRYDPEYARQQITDAMTAAGAELVDGTVAWTSAASPSGSSSSRVPEDERREIGDLVRAELEAAGFQVSMILQGLRARGHVGVLHRSRRPSSGTCTPRAGAAAAPSATTPAPSTP